MATVAQKSYSNIRPIRFNLRDRDKSLDLAIPAKYATQQGASFLEYNFLTSLNDVKTKNYTVNYLTDTKTEPNIFDLNFDENVNNSFITTLKFDNDDNKYLTINKDGTSLSSFTTLSALSTGEDNLFTNQSFVIDLSSKDGISTCQVWTYDGIYKKFLVQRGLDQTVSPQIIFDTLNPSENLSRATFQITFDNNNALLHIDNEINISTETEVVSTQFIIGANGQELSALSGFNSSDLASATFSIENYNAVDTNYSSYSNNFVYYTSGANIDLTKSLPDQKYNFLFYNTYEKNYLSGDEVYGELCYFNLKNQISNNNNVNKNLPFSLPQQQRYYNSILNNETEEISNENLELSYNFHTAEYKFEPDRYTKFIFPSNIIPFKNININDAGLQEAGAYAAGSPYYSDRVYKLQDESNFNKINEENGTFLCSWLYDDGNGGEWLDRYYLPKLTSPVASLSGTANKHTTQIEQISSAYGLGDKNMYYFDVRSSLSFEPNGTYFYARIGNSYVSKTLNGISNRVIKTDFNINSLTTESVLANQEKIFFDGKVYDEFVFPSQLDSDQGAMSLSFSLNVPSLSAAKAHQLIGNLYNTGISFIKNFYYTPFVIIPHENTLRYYDNNFNLVNTVTIGSLSGIKDVCYMLQSGDLVVMGESSTGSKILRIDYNGNIIRESSHSLAAALVDSNYTSRVFFGVGSTARFFAGNTTYNLDLQTLSIDILAAAPGQSAVLSAVGTPIAAISGLKGINIDGNFAASLSAATGIGASQGTAVLFTDYSTGEQFRAINSQYHRIWDINAFDDKLYVQSDKLYVFNTDRELLSTINLSTSAVSGYKIDFISEDYVVNPIVFSRDVNNNLIVDKIITTENNTVSTYSLGISSIDLGHPTSPIAGNFVSPTNLHSIEDTFKEYEDKFCFVSRFDNERAVQGVLEPWDGPTESLYDHISAGNWSINYTSAGGTLVDNSTVNIIEGIHDGHNCIQADLDLVTGRIRIFVDGTETTSFTINAGIKPLKNYLYNDFYIGAPNFANGSILDYKSDSKSLARNMVMGNINVFDTTLDTDILNYLYLDCHKNIDTVNYDVVTSPRNNIETINNFYTYKIPGNLSNRIKILIKNGNLTLDDQQTIKNALRKRMVRLLPATINVSDIDFDFTVGNEQPIDPEAPLQSQPILPIEGGPLSNVFDPGSGFFSVEVTTDLEPVLFDRDGTTAFIMVI
jgi:hypothetical protein